MHPSINQVADSLIPDFDEDGMSESESPDVVDQCINDDSYEVQVADSLWRVRGMWYGGLLPAGCS